MRASDLVQSLKQRLTQRLEQQQQSRQKRHSRKAATQSFQEQAAHASTRLTRSGRSVNQLYRKLSGKILSLAVKPKVIGATPAQLSIEPSATNGPETDHHSIANDSAVGSNAPLSNDLTFYVLKEYSRSNSILVDVQTRETGLPPALRTVEDEAHHINENAAVIFLKHPHAGTRKVSPRLARLVNAYRQNPELKITLIPVSILWGRVPDKESSLFKLLMADNWEEPTIAKQLFNIGVMGRDTLVEFHTPQILGTLIDNLVTLKIKDQTPALTPSKADADLLREAESHLQNATLVSATTCESTTLVTADEANFSLTLLIQHQLNIYLDNQRKSVLGPDLSDKRNLVDKLIKTPAIDYATDQEVKHANISKQEAQARARGYANEIVNNYTYSVVRSFYLFLDWLWTQLYDGVEVHNFERVRKLAGDYEVIYVPCHRSHVDYLLLAYIIYKEGVNLPYVAAGNNLDIPVLGPMLRSAIAFYIRRSFKDNDLYKAVLREYLHTLIQRNTPIEYFIEGGRSRSGRLLPPKLGMLAMTVHSYLRSSENGGGKPIVFVPAYIGYERLMEGGTYVGEMKGAPKKGESIMGLLKVTRKIERIFGHVHLSFGAPLFLDDFMEKFDVAPNSLPADRTDTPFNSKTEAMVDNLGVKIMQNINKAVVVNPISLLSLVLLSAPTTALDEERCLDQLALCQQMALKVPYDVDTTVTTLSPKAIIDYGIKLKLIERTPHILGDMIKVLPNQVALLSYFRNNILHVYILSSLVAALIARNGRIERSRLHNIGMQLYPFLQSELFLFRSVRNLPQILDDRIAVLIEQGVIVDLGDGILGAPENNSELYQQLNMLAVPVSQSLERYFMSLALLAQQGSGQLTAAQVVDLCHLLGQRLSTLYADDMPDFFDRALFTSFLNALIRLDYVQEATETGLLNFDDRIENIARHAHFVLNPDMMQILHHIADLDREEIEHAISEINQKKASKFSRKR